MHSCSAVDKELKLLQAAIRRASCGKECAPAAALSLAVEKLSAHPKSYLGSAARLAAGPSPSASFDTSSNAGFRKSQDSVIKRLGILARHFSVGLGSNDY